MNELYIRMCREAREIQDLRPKHKFTPKVEDGVINDCQGYRWFVEPTSTIIYIKILWLPRQEDLIQIFRVKNGNPDDYWILKSFLVWFSHLTGYPTACPDREVSITQLWLQYVMETVYNKRWNVEEDSWELIC